MRNSNIFYALLLLVGDCVAIVAAFVFAFVLRVELSDEFVEPVGALAFIKFVASLLPVWIVFFAFTGLYRKETYSRLAEEVPRVLVGSMVGVLSMMSYDFLTAEPLFPAKVRVPLYALGCVFVLLITERAILRRWRRFMYRFGVGAERALIVGNSVHTQTLINQLKDTSRSGYAIIGVVSRKKFSGVSKHYGTFNTAKADLKSRSVTMLIQTELYEDDHKNAEVFSAAQLNHISYKFIPANSYFYGFKNTVEVVSGFPTVNVHQTPLIGWGRVVKRGFDIVGSIIGLIAFSPILLAVALINKVRNPRAPIFYTVQRVTRYGQTRKIYKFRSMIPRWSGREDREAIFAEMGRPDLVELVKKGDSQIPDDPRISGFGRFIRATTIDELPQLYNVLKGDISLVGPRAIEKKELKLYKKSGDLMLSVRTGLTGLAQVSGRSNLPYEERARLNMLYVQSWSFWLDVRIILKTFGVLIARINKDREL